MPEVVHLTTASAGGTDVIAFEAGDGEPGLDEVAAAPGLGGLAGHWS
jgi:hypothetical protein